MVTLSHGSDRSLPLVLSTRSIDDATPTQASDDHLESSTVSAELIRKREHRLGRYVLKQLLGSGGSGQVYLAWKDNLTGEVMPCVVKFPLQRYAIDDSGRWVFLHEARLLVRLGIHPNIVQVIDVDEYRSMPFIVMEFVDGVDLDVLLKRLRDRRQRLSLPSIYCVFAGAAAGLHHAHFGATRAGQPVSIVHRDVKPGNLLVTRKGFVKLVDFGIGVALEEGTSGSHLRGTTRYMSPEHIEGNVCPEMDVYSLGVVVWEMIAGKLFRDGLTKAQALHAILDGTIPPMDNPECPEKLQALVHSCLNPDARRRPSASDILLALQRCPGYTAEPSLLARELSTILGTAPSSGATDRQFAATPDLVATMAVLEHSELAVASRSSFADPEPEQRPTVVQVDDDGREIDAPKRPHAHRANECLLAQAGAPKGDEPHQAAEGPRVRGSMPDEVDTGATTRELLR